MAAGAGRQTTPNARLAVAASGGLDSTALLHCVHRLCLPFGIEVHALHVNHGLHPDAAAWQQQLRRQCARWSRPGAPLVFTATRLAGGPPKGESIEAWARHERYAALAAMARAQGCRVVLLAHHRRDQAETVLLQALRGGGPRGLAAMPREAERDGLLWLRPWLSQPRSRIEAYVRRWRLAHVEDPGNVDRRFARNRLRHAVWPALAASFPDAEAALARLARRASEAAEVAAVMADIDARQVLDAGVLLVGPWSALGPGRRANLLRHWLGGMLAGPVPESLVERLLAELPACLAARWPAGEHNELRLHRGRLTVARASPDAPPRLAERAIDLGRPGVYAAVPWPGRFEVAASPSGGVPASVLRQARLCARHGGEQFQAEPAARPRSLKKQFQAAGVPAWERDGPLVYAGDRLVFVPGLGLDARARGGSGEERLTLRWVR